jgi:hypothetical protein
MNSQQKYFHENLPTINRNILVVEPTEVFLEWARKCFDEDADLTIEELTEDLATYLIPEQDADAEAWLFRNFRTIFEIELESWCADPALWPKIRSLKVFKTFFRIHFHSSILDLGKGTIVKEYI